jgi:citrate lyase beta subunit
MWRSILFVPGDDERKLSRALGSDAGAVVVDLEDAVASERKAAARELVSRILRERRAVGATLIRVNGFGTPQFADDLAMVAELGLDGIVVPKADPESMAALPPTVGPAVGIVETALGLLRVDETASSSRVVRLLLGTVDLSAELRLQARPDGLELLHARSRVVEVSAAFGLEPPIDGVHVDIRDLAGLEAATRLARSLGFGGKACIHPEQVATVNGVFSPDAASLAEARGIIEAYGEAVSGGRGAVEYNGKMIDAAVVQRARAIVRDAEEVNNGRS